jgi:secondary thiamine-phosphate synthase enzyme
VTQFTHQIQVDTNGKGLYEITGKIDRWVAERGLRTGLLTVFVQHTSASLTIQENADRDVILDLNDFFSRLVPENTKWFRHTVEGADDMPAHIRAALTQVNLSIPLHAGKLVLGTWQGIYVFEHRAIPHRRSVFLHLAGEP